MRQLVGAAFLLLLGMEQGNAAPPAPDVGPKRIMSLTVCTDELLMDLAPPSRIASISYLSREKSTLKLWPEAAQLPVNRNSAEEVLAEKPDMVLTLTYASTDLESLLKKSGIRFLDVPETQDFDQIRAVTRMVGDAIGERSRAEQLIARMDARLAQLAASRPKQTIRVAGWGGNGFVPGSGTLFNAVLEVAGGHNITGRDAYYDVENLIAARPDVLAFGDNYIDMPSLRRDQNDHPVLMKLFANRRITYPSALYGCGVPQSADAAVTLRAQLLAAMAKPGGVP
jgi:iron complex transport system substrate-binding protein